MSHRPTKEEAEKKLAHVKDLIGKNLSVREIAADLEVSTQAVHKYLRRHELEVSPA